MSDKPIIIHFEKSASSDAPSTDDAGTSAPTPKPFVTDLDAQAIALFMTIDETDLASEDVFNQKTDDLTSSLTTAEASKAAIMARAGEIFFKGQCAKAEYRKSMHRIMRKKAEVNSDNPDFKAFLGPAKRMVLSNQIYIPAMRNAYQYQSPTKKSYYRLSNPGMLEKKNYSLLDGIYNMVRLGPTAPRASIDAAKHVLTQLVAAANPVVAAANPEDNDTKKLFLTDLTGSGLNDGECHAAAAVKIAARELMRENIAARELMRENNDQPPKVNIIVQNSSVYGLGMSMGKMFYDPFNRSNAVNTDIYDLSSQDTNTSQNVQNARTLYQSAVAHYNKQTFSPNPEQFFVLAAQKIYAREQGYLCASWCKSGKDREAVLTNMVQAMDMCIYMYGNFNLYDNENKIDSESLEKLATAYWQCFTTQLEGKNQHEAIAGRLSPGADGTMEHIALLPKELKNAIFKKYPHAKIVFEVSHAKGKLNKKQNWKKAIQKRDALIKELGLKNPDPSDNLIKRQLQKIGLIKSSAPPSILEQLQYKFNTEPVNITTKIKKQIKAYETDQNRNDAEAEKIKEAEKIQQYQKMISLLELDQCITKAKKEANPGKSKSFISKNKKQILLALVVAALAITAVVFPPVGAAIVALGLLVQASPVIAAVSTVIAAVSTYAAVALVDSVRVGMKGGLKNGLNHFRKWLIVPIALVAAGVSVLVHAAIKNPLKTMAAAVALAAIALVIAVPPIGIPIAITLAATAALYTGGKFLYKVLKPDSSQPVYDKLLAGLDDEVVPNPQIEQHQPPKLPPPSDPNGFNLTNRDPTVPNAALEELRACSHTLDAKTKLATDTADEITADETQEQGETLHSDSPPKEIP